MDEQDPAAGQRREQATQWFARLKSVPVSKGTLEAFFEWRRDPANAAAFAEVEALWGDAGRIGARPAMLRLVEEAMKRQHRPRSRWPLISGLALGACLLFAVAAGRWWMADSSASLDAATVVGERDGHDGEGWRSSKQGSEDVDAHMSILPPLRAGASRRRERAGLAALELGTRRDRPHPDEEGKN